MSRVRSHVPASAYHARVMRIFNMFEQLDLRLVMAREREEAARMRLIDRAGDTKPVMTWAQALEAGLTHSALLELRRQGRLLG